MECIPFFAQISLPQQRGSSKHWTESENIFGHVLPAIHTYTYRCRYRYKYRRRYRYISADTEMHIQVPTFSAFSHNNFSTLLNTKAQLAQLELLAGTLSGKCLAYNFPFFPDTLKGELTNLFNPLLKFLTSFNRFSFSNKNYRILF